MTSNGNSKFSFPGISKRTMERKTRRRRQSSAYVSCVESWKYSSSRNRGYESAAALSTHGAAFHKSSKKVVMARPLRWDRDQALNCLIWNSCPLPGERQLGDLDGSSRYRRHA